MNTIRLKDTLAAFDAANQQDPNIELVDGKSVPKEWIYAQRMTDTCTTFANPLPKSCNWRHAANIFAAGKYLAVITLWINKVIKNGVWIWQNCMETSPAR